jgi:putative nucleotidyltransferase with HDIG domain
LRRAVGCVGRYTRVLDLERRSAPQTALVGHFLPDCLSYLAFWRRKLRLHPLRVTALRSTRVRLRDRSIALLHLLLLLSGVTLLASAITLSLLLGAVVRRQANSNVRNDLSHATSVVLASGRIGDLLTKPAAAAEATHRLLRNPNVARVEIVRDGQAVSLTPGHDQIVYQKALQAQNGRQGQLLVLSRPIGATSGVGSQVRYIWLSVALVCLTLFVLLALMARGALRVLRGRNRALAKQSEALLDAYRRLERSSFEAIESLNAAVDAKDPSTAGHSQRVEQIAVRIGRELGFDPARLELLRLGALFHDIGKLAVPDAILLKPARLTRQEFEVIKRHCEDGARIVDRFGPLRPVVSIIRHHHEHWSGAGYPAGLEGKTIPIEASIVGVADSWDAMTTNRPYKAMLSVEEAREEVKRCRGTQFRPDVVDALLNALEQDPELFAPLDALPDPGDERASVPSLRVAAESAAIGFSEA